MESSELTAGSFLFFLLLLLFVFWIARRNQFFKLPEPDAPVPVTWLQSVGAYLTYLIFAALLIPLVSAVISYFVTGNYKGISFLSQESKGWIQALGLFGLFALLLVYCRLLKNPSAHYIFWGNEPKSWARFTKGITMGFIAWVVSYPFVLASNALSSYISTQIWGKSELEQVAVKQLKLTMGHPTLLTAMVLLVVFLVPFMEELLFRGFLQNTLKRHLGRRWAIILTAAIFAMFHYAPSQGVGNFQLIFSLIVLAFFLGFIYERERTLWAPIALHSTFNGLNVLAILLAK